MENKPVYKQVRINGKKYGEVGKKNLLCRV